MSIVDYYSGKLFTSIAVLIVVIRADMSIKLSRLQWIFWVGPFIGAALAAVYHQVVIRAIQFKTKS